MSPCFSSQGAFGHAFGPFSFVSLWLCRRSWQFEVPSSSLGRRMVFSFRICIALGWPSHFAPFVMFVLSVLSLVYHWFIMGFVCFIALGLYVSVNFPDHRRSPVWSVPYSHELLQPFCVERLTKISRCESMATAPGFVCIVCKDLKLKSWPSISNMPTLDQHWTNMVGHLDPANLWIQQLAIEK